MGQVGDIFGKDEMARLNGSGKRDWLLLTFELKFGLFGIGFEGGKGFSILMK